MHIVLLNKYISKVFLKEIYRHKNNFIFLQKICQNGIINAISELIITKKQKNFYILQEKSQ